MRVMKNKATLLSLAVAGLFAASAAQAQVNLDTGLGAPVFASELTAANLTAGGAPVTVTGKINFGVSTGQLRYVRYDLSGATFATVVVAADLTTANQTPSVVLGGQVGDNFVVFEITATGAGILATQLNTWVPSAGNIKFATGTTVGVRYTLHETAVSAGGTVSGGANTNSGRLVDESATLIKFTKVVSFTMAGSTPEIVAATTTFTKFCFTAPNTGVPGTSGCAATSTDQLAMVGSIANYGLVDVTHLDATSTAITGLATVISAGTLTATTSASTFQTAGTAGFILSTNNCAAIGAGGALNAGKSIITYTLPAPTAAQSVIGTGGGTATALCYGVDGTTAILDQTINGSFNPTYTAAYGQGVTPASQGQIGQFVRDGVELQAPWFTIGGTGSAYISRFFLTNTGASAVTCQVTLFGETGNTITANTTPNAQGNSAAGVTVPAGGQVSVTGQDLVTSVSGLARLAVRFTCPAPSTTMQGRYVVTHTSGAVDSGTLLRPGTN